MSQENVEIVQRKIEAFRGGAEGGDFGVAFETGAVATDVEWIAFAELEQRSFRGREGFIEFMRGWTEDFEGWSAQLERLVDAGNDCAVAFFHQTATGKGSGAPVEMDYAVIYELKGGQLVRMRAYAEREKALEAAGLRE
jgi:ketosteroid isomerase-like protein